MYSTINNLKSHSTILTTYFTIVINKLTAPFLTPRHQHYHYTLFKKKIKITRRATNKPFHR